MFYFIDTNQRYIPLIGGNFDSNVVSSLNGQGQKEPTAAPQKDEASKNFFYNQTSFEFLLIKGEYSRLDEVLHSIAEVINNWIAKMVINDNVPIRVYCTLFNPEYRITGSTVPLPIRLLNLTEFIKLKFEYFYIKRKEDAFLTNLNLDVSQIVALKPEYAGQAYTEDFETYCKNIFEHGIFKIWVEHLFINSTEKDFHENLLNRLNIYSILYNPTKNHIEKREKLEEVLQKCDPECEYVCVNDRDIWIYKKIN